MKFIFFGILFLCSITNLSSQTFFCADAENIITVENNFTGNIEDNISIEFDDAFNSTNYNPVFINSSFFFADRRSAQKTLLPADEIFLPPEIK